MGFAEGAEQDRVGSDDYDGTGMNPWLSSLTDRSDETSMLMRRFGSAVDEVEVDEDGWKVSLDLEKLQNLTSLSSDTTFSDSSESLISDQYSNPEQIILSRSLETPEFYNVPLKSVEERTDELRVQILKDKVRRFRDKMEQLKSN